MEGNEIGLKFLHRSDCYKMEWKTSERLKKYERSVTPEMVDSSSQRDHYCNNGFTS
ncbi:hypothetical protein LINGRAHAP2_LOCUS19682 [Linum grandiflorum]